MANVSFTYNATPAPACYPPDMNGLAQQLTTGGMLVGTIPDNAGGGMWVGTTPPTSAITYKVWLKTDPAGRPLGIFTFYNGNWRKVYSGVGYGELRMYTGTNAVFDGTGRGIVGGDFDGWALCNGNNGTPNLTDYFMVGGAWSGSGWVTDTDGLGNKGSGGARGPIRIDRTRLPELIVTAYGALVAGPGSGAYAAANVGQTPVGSWPVIDGTGLPVTGQNQQPLPLPLFFAVAYMMFIGYA